MSFIQSPQDLTVLLFIYFLKFSYLLTKSQFASYFLLKKIELCLCEYLYVLQGSRKIKFNYS